MHAIFQAKVMHRRLRPKENAFVYPVMYFARTVGQNPQTRLLKTNRPWLYGFYEKDHGPRDGSPLLPWIRGVLAEYGLAEIADGEVVLVAHPRMLGFVFNPVSFWLCFDKERRLRAVLAAVNNTFGDRHSYLIAHEDGRPIEGENVLEAKKLFHVSPFLPIEGKYYFRFQVTDRALGIRIDYEDSAGLMLQTALTGVLKPLTDRALALHFLGAPLMTFGVLWRIHYQALKLWFKKARFYKRPEPPTEIISR